MLFTGTISSWLTGSIQNSNLCLMYGAWITRIISPFCEVKKMELIGPPPLIMLNLRSGSTSDRLCDHCYTILHWSTFCCQLYKEIKFKIRNLHSKYMYTVSKVCAVHLPWWYWIWATRYKSYCGSLEQPQVDSLTKFKTQILCLMFGEHG